MLPLEGYRAIDFGWVYAGPILGQLLADYGAEVIKIETQARLDASRRGRPIISPHVERGDAGLEPDRIPMFHGLNRNKLGVTVDLTRSEGREVALKLVAQADVVLENFAPGVMGRLGLDYGILRRRKPDLVMVSLSSAGQYGPMKDVRTYAPGVTALAGLDSLAGYAGEDPVSVTNLFFGDPNGGLFGFLGVMAALHHREQTGESQYIDLSQTEAVAAHLGEAVMDYTMNRRVQRSQGSHRPIMTFQGNYPCQGEDSWVSIAVKTDEEWRAFCQVMGNPDWTAEPRFADRFSRQRHRDALDRLVAEWTRTRDAYEVTEALQRAGVAAMPVLNIATQYADPHYQERGTYVTCPHPMVGDEPLPGLPWRLSETPGEVRRHAPLLGEHNDHVFQGLLGLEREEVRRLAEASVIY